MSDQWASENLQTIRTLMERSAVYRRALAPVLTATGAIGMVAAFAGWKANIAAPGAFILYWLGVAIAALAAGLVLIRRQALQQSEPFWSPPTRRVSQAMLPALTAGLILGVIVLLRYAGGMTGDPAAPAGGGEPAYFPNVCLPLVWVMLYGCAVHAAGFFMKRGVRLFGWILMITGCLGLLPGKPETTTGLVDLGFGIMGIVFGLLHLVYGLYLFATEKRSPAE